METKRTNVETVSIPRNTKLLASIDNERIGVQRNDEESHSREYLRDVRRRRAQWLIVDEEWW